MLPVPELFLTLAFQALVQRERRRPPVLHRDREVVAERVLLQLGGRRSDPDVVRWWEVLGTLKWGIMCIVQAFTHLSGAARSVELATIGRRVCENEWDLLELIDA